MTTWTAFALIVILIGHWVGDFVAQSDDMAKRKADDGAVLVTHVAIYAGVLGFFCLLVLPAPLALLYIALNALAHFVTDMETSRWTKKLHLAGDRHNFFVVIGFDQLLHGATLVYTYSLILPEPPQ